MAIEYVNTDPAEPGDNDVAIMVYITGRNDKIPYNANGTPIDDVVTDVCDLHGIDHVNTEIQTKIRRRNPESSGTKTVDLSGVDTSTACFEPNDILIITPGKADGGF